MITCFEHGKLECTGALRAALERHFGDKGVPYYSLIRGGVKFNQYVGVLQVGKTTVEVLPKIDRISDDAGRWRNVLIDMLRKTLGIDLKTSENANLRLKPDSILDLYFGLLVTEVEYLCHVGLVKRYRRTEGNALSLKGKLQFSQHVRKNMVHAERFYVAYTTYDRDNAFNQILRQALVLVQSLSADGSLQGRIARLLLDFPEFSPIVVTDSTFGRLPWSRKTEGYRQAMQLARLILLNFHPDIRGGAEDVLALMFDMNKLWEGYVLQRLRDAAPEGWSVEAQRRQGFWDGDGMDIAQLKPDIILHGPEGQRLVLDTKWKLLDRRPGDEDLRQLFAYLHRWEASAGYLVYPDKCLHRHPGRFHVGKRHCHVLTVDVLGDNGRLNPQLGQHIWEKILPETSQAAVSGTMWG